MEVLPIAQEMHRQDLLVPESLIQKMAGLGLFGCSIPESYGGTEMGYLTMVVLTEELSTVSLVAGSLITRSEILTRALLQGGTEEQRQHWLPRIASGELLVGVSVTEPDVGSDAASVTCKATPGEHEGEKGWFIEGPKAWSTFAGRANILALLARTNPDVSLGTGDCRSLLFRRSRMTGIISSTVNPAAGRSRGRQTRPPGIAECIPSRWRSIATSSLRRTWWVVMLGWGRASICRWAGLLPGGCRRVAGRRASVRRRSKRRATTRRTGKQFGKAIADYQLTQYKIGRMATHVAAGRHLSYAAARAMESDERASMEAAMCKLFASDVAVWVSQEAQLIHGGWGYSEEDPVARFVVDALVLPIFEGVKPILELKVIARQLLAG